MKLVHYIRSLTPLAVVALSASAPLKVGADWCPPQSNYVANLTFTDALTSTTMGMAFDGTSYWSISGGNTSGNRLARYDATGALLGTYAPGLDFRSIFTDATGTVYARVYASSIIYRQTGPGVFTNQVTLSGGTLDAQSSVVFNAGGTEFIAMNEGVVSRWSSGGAYLGTVTLSGFGSYVNENVYPQNRGIAVAGPYWLTYNASDGMLSFWDQSGNRLARGTLQGAGTGFSFSFCNTRAFVVDVGGGTWRGYQVCIQTPPDPLVVGIHAGVAQELNALATTLTNLGFAVRYIDQGQWSGINVVVSYPGDGIGPTRSEISNGTHYVQISDYGSDWTPNFWSWVSPGTNITMALDAAHPITTGLPASWSSHGFWYYAGGDYVGWSTDTNMPSLARETAVVNQSRVLTASPLGSGRAVYMGWNVYGPEASLYDVAALRNAILWAGGAVSPVTQTLVFYGRSSGASPFATALTNLAMPFQLFCSTQYVSFEASVAWANPANTLVIVDTPSASGPFTNVIAFINAGGRAVMDTYFLQSQPALAAAFQATPVFNFSTPLPVYNWGNTLLFAGLSSPLSFVDSWVDDGDKLAPGAGALAAAGFVGSPAANEAAIVLGNAGRTLVNGFLFDEITPQADAVQLARNEILQVARGGVAPVILGQPQNVTTNIGSPVSFGVAATGNAPLKYQWRFNGTNVLAGATGASVTLPVVSVADAGGYSVVVAKNYGAVTSTVATLTVRVGLYSVLLIYDDNNTDTAALVNALANAGITVTLSATSETNYNGANPSPNGFSAVIQLNGTTYSTDMPLAGQNALVNYVQNGGGYIQGEWDAYEYGEGHMVNLRDLILLDRLRGDEVDVTYDTVPAQAGHPVLADIPSSFTFQGGQNLGRVHAFAINPATVLMRSWVTNDAVAVRQYGLGRIVGFSHAGNYLTTTYHTLLDPNIQQLYINAVRWAGNPQPITQALLFYGWTSGTSPFATALGNLAIPYQLFYSTQYTSFDTAVGAASAANTLVIADDPGNSYAFNNLIGFVNGGGRAVMDYYDLDTYPTLAAAFQVAAVGNLNPPLPVHDWGGSAVFTGLSSPLSFTDRWFDNGDRLQPVGSAESLAGFVGGPSGNQSAIVLGHFGRTLVNGFLLSDITATADAVRLAQNEIMLMTGYSQPPSIMLLPPIAGAGQFEFSFATLPDMFYVVEYKNRLTDPVWTPIQTNLGNGALNIVVVPAVSPPQRFFRVRLQ